MPWSKEDLRERVKALTRFAGLTDWEIADRLDIGSRRLKMLIAHGGPELIDLEPELSKLLMEKARHLRQVQPSNPRERFLLEEMAQYLESLA